MDKINNAPSCDLAIEAHEMLAGENTEDFSIPGVSVEEALDGDFINITRVCVKDDEGAKRLGKPCGNYVTIEMPRRFYGQQKIYEQMCRSCAREIKEIVKNIIQEECVLVVGLGNRNIIADALGPKVVDSLMITRHLKKYIPNEIDEGVRPVCAIAPGVLGLTGIETVEIIRGLSEQIKPSAIIVIDALCSGSVERINTTIQITDTGITPGSGVGNKRKTINSQSLGVPVIAIGVPTVVDAATIAITGIETAIKNSKYDELSSLDRQERYDKIRAAVEPELGNMIVAPKDVDNIISDISSVIANGINISLHRGITLSDIDRYV